MQASSASRRVEPKYLGNGVVTVALLLRVLARGNTYAAVAAIFLGRAARELRWRDGVQVPEAQLRPSGRRDRFLGRQVNCETSTQLTGRSRVSRGGRNWVCAALWGFPPV